MTPLMISALMAAIELAIVQFNHNNKDMTDEELIAYIAEQEDRKKNLLAMIDEA